jgi:hypothetical protein
MVPIGERSEIRYVFALSDPRLILVQPIMGPGGSHLFMTRIRSKDMPIRGRIRGSSNSHDVLQYSCRHSISLAINPYRHMIPLILMCGCGITYGRRSRTPTPPSLSSERAWEVNQGLRGWKIVSPTSLCKEWMVAVSRTDTVMRNIHDTTFLQYITVVGARPRWGDNCHGVPRLCRLPR